MSTQKLIERDVPSNISILESDKIWYPVRDFFDEDEMVEASFKASNGSEIIDISKVVEQLKFDEKIDQIAHFALISEKKLGILTVENDFYDFDINEDTLSLTPGLKKVRIASPKTHKCLKIVPPHASHKTYIPCMRFKTKEVYSKIQISSDLEKLMDHEMTKTQFERNYGMDEPEIHVYYDKEIQKQDKDKNYTKDFYERNNYSDEEAEHHSKHMTEKNHDYDKIVDSLDDLRRRRVLQVEDLNHKPRQEKKSGDKKVKEAKVKSKVKKNKKKNKKTKKVKHFNPFKYMNPYTARAKLMPDNPGLGNIDFYKFYNESKHTFHVMESGLISYQHKILQKKFIDIYHLDLDSYKKGDKLKRFEVMLHKNEVYGEYNFLFAKFGPEEKTRMLFYVSPLDPKNNLRYIFLRHFVFDDDENVIDSQLMKYEVACIGFVRYRGVQIYNNDKFMFIADKVIGNEGKYFVELLIDPIKNSLHTNNMGPIKFDTDLNTIYAQRENKMIQILHLKKDRTTKKEDHDASKDKTVVSVCHILQTGYKDKCSFYDLSNFSGLKHDGNPIDYIVKDNLLVLTTRSKMGVPHFFASFGKRFMGFNRYKPFTGTGYPLVMGNRLFIANKHGIQTHLAVEPHLIVKGSNSKGEVILKGKDADGEKSVKIPISVVNEEKEYYSIESVPRVYDIELGPKSEHISTFFDFRLVKGNIKKVELVSSNSNKNSAIQVKLVSSESVNFSYDHDFYEIDQNMMLTIDNKTEIQVHNECTFFRKEDNFLCKNHSPKISFKDLGGFTVHSHLVDGKFSLIDVVTKNTQETKIIVAGPFQQDDTELTIQSKELITGERNNHLSAFVKITKHKYGYIICDEEDCTVVVIAIHKDHFSLTHLGYIDDLFIQSNKFCPKKIISYPEDVHQFLIVSQCGESQPKFIFKFLLQDRVMLYESFTKVQADTPNISLCSNDLLAFYSQKSGEIRFRRFGLPIGTEQNIVDVSKFGIHQVKELHCKFSSVVIVGEIDETTLTEEGKPRRKMIVLEKREVDRKESYVDRKKSLVRYSGHIDDFDNLKMFRSAVHLDDFTFLVLDKEGEKRKIQVMSTSIGPIIDIKIKDKNLIKKTEVNESYSLKVTGFDGESKLVPFKVFSKKYDSHFDVKFAAKNSVLLKKESTFKFENLFKEITGKMIGFSIKNNNPEISSYSGGIAEITKVEGKIPEKIIPEFFKLTSGKQLTVGLYEKMGEQIESEWEDEPDQIIKKHVQLYYFKNNVFQKNQKLKKIVLPSDLDTFQLKLARGQVRSGSDSQEVIVSYTYQKPARKNRTIAIIITNPDGKVLVNKVGSFPRIFDSFNVFYSPIKTKFEDNTGYFVQVKSHDSLGNMIIDIFRVIYDTFNSHILSLEKISSKKIQNMINMRIIDQGKGNLLAVFMDSSQMIQVSLFQGGSGFTNKDKIYKINESHINYKIMNLICTSFGEKSLNEKYYGHCLGISDQQTHSYFRLSKQSNNSKDLQVDLEFEKLYLPNHFEHHESGLEWRLTDGYVYSKVQGLYSSYNLVDSQKIESKEMRYGVLAWKIVNIGDSNSGSNNKIIDEFPSVFVATTDKNSDFSAQTTQIKGENTEFLFLSPSGHMGTSFFRIRKEMEKKPLFKIVNTHKFIESNAELSVFGLTKQYTVKARDLFNFKKFEKEYNESEEKVREDKKRKQEERLERLKEAEIYQKKAQKKMDDERIERERKEKEASENRKEKKREQVAQAIIELEKNADGDKNKNKEAKERGTNSDDKTGIKIWQIAIIGLFILTIGLYAIYLKLTPNENVSNKKYGIISSDESTLSGNSSKIEGEDNEEIETFGADNEF